MSHPFLDLGDVCLIGKRIGRRCRPQRECTRSPNIRAQGKAQQRSSNVQRENVGRASPLSTQGIAMTIDAHVLMLFASCSFVAFCAAVVAGFWYQNHSWTQRVDYQQRMWSERCDLIREIAQAEGELRAYKNQQIMHHRGKRETGFFLFRRTVEKNLYLEYRDCKLSRAILGTLTILASSRISAPGTSQPFGSCWVRLLGERVP